MGYAFVDRTADVAADLTGTILSELFVSAAQALTATITDIEQVRVLETGDVRLEAGSLDDLLVDWLNELLYRFEVQNLLVHGAVVKVEQRDGRWHLTAVISGDRFDSSRHSSRVLVKGATYHGLRVARDGDTWRARIVFDI